MFLHSSIPQTLTEQLHGAAPVAPNAAQTGPPPVRCLRSGGEAGHGNSDCHTRGEVGPGETRAHPMHPPGLGPRDLGPVGLALGPGGEVAFSRQKREGERHPRQSNQHKPKRRGRQGPDAGRPPILGRGAWGAMDGLCFSCDTVRSECWPQGWGARLEPGDQGCKDSVWSPSTQPRSRWSKLLPPAGVLSPAEGPCSLSLQEELGNGERARTVRDPRRALTCGLEAGTGSVPIHLVSPGRFPEGLQLLWAEFPGFQPAPSPTPTPHNALPPRQPPHFCPLCPWETQGALGQISRRAGRGGD